MAAATPDRSYIQRKSAKALVIAFKLSPAQLQSLASGASPASTPADDTTTPSLGPAASTATPDDNASDANTPVPNVPGAAAMPPPTDGRKKGGKRKSDVLGGDGTPKVRGKPGPKKKLKLDDGTDAPRANGAGAAHKLGPKASLGAINAGLRALDRSGKPTRKWKKNGFVLKSFTGIVWEVNRWKAPPKLNGLTGESEGSVSGVESGSGKENKESTAQSEKSEKSAALDVEDVPMAGSAAASVHASSPAPVVAASA